MAPTLPRVDPTQPPGLLRRAFAAVAAWRVARFISRHVNWKLDVLLLRLTNGRFSTTFGIRTAVLETRGRRSGALRRNAVIYWHDGDRVTITASNAGSAHHPAWYHNLVAQPHVTLGGTPMRATLVPEDEHARLWVLGDRVLPTFARYRREAEAAGRTIPLIQLDQEPEVS